MKKNFKLIFPCGFFASLAIIVSLFAVQSCRTKHISERRIATDAEPQGMIMGDDIEAIDEGNGKISIKNIVTGETTIKNIKVEWTSDTNDSLAVFSTGGRRGYYDVFTGKIVIEPKYRRAWLFSDGLAAVQKKGKIGFIDRTGKVVIPFNYPYHGNPLTEFVFKNGRCAVANDEGKCGIIDTLGNWIIKPEYDDIDMKRDYFIARTETKCSQISYGDKVINDNVVESIHPLTYTKEEIYENKDGELCTIEKTVGTGFYVYYIGGRCGLMDSNCKRVTEPLFENITVVDKNLFSCQIEWYSTAVLVNSKGEVVK